MIKLACAREAPPNCTVSLTSQRHSEKLPEVAGTSQGNIYIRELELPYSSDSQESSCNAGDLGLIPGSGRYSGEGNGNLLQYSCLENSMDKED